MFAISSPDEFLVYRLDVLSVSQTTALNRPQSTGLILSSFTTGLLIEDASV